MTSMVKIDEEANLTVLESRWIDEFFKDFDAAAAARRAGYSAKSASSAANALMKRPAVRAEMARRHAVHSDKLGLTAERIANEMAHIAFSNMGDFLKRDEEGNVVGFNFKGLTRDQMAAIGEFTIDSLVKTDSEGVEEYRVIKTKFKLHPKLEALVHLGKYVGMFKSGEDDKGPTTLNFTFNVTDNRQITNTR